MSRSPTPPLGPILATFVIGFLVATSASVRAHEFVETPALVLLSDDGAFRIDLGCDLDALALGADPATDSAEVARALLGLEPDQRQQRIDRLSQYFLRRVRVLADGEPTPFAVAFPERGRFLQAPEDADTATSHSRAAPVLPPADLPPTYLGTTARLEGFLPEGTTSVAIRASRSFPPLAVRVLRESSSPVTVVGQGLPSPEIPLVPEPAPPSFGVGSSATELAMVIGAWAVIGSGLLLPLFVLGLVAMGLPRHTNGHSEIAGSELRSSLLFFVATTVLATALGASGQLWLAPPAAAIGACATLLLIAVALLVRGRSQKPTFEASIRLPALVACGLLHGQLLALRFLAETSDWPAARGTTGAGVDTATAWAYAAGSLVALIAFGSALAFFLHSSVTCRGRRFATVLGIALVVAGSLALGSAIDERHRLARAPFAVAETGSEETGEGTLAEASEVPKNTVFTLFLRPFGTSEEGDP